MANILKMPLRIINIVRWGFSGVFVMMMYVEIRNRPMANLQKVIIIAPTPALLANFAEMELIVKKMAEINIAR